MKKFRFVCLLLLVVAGLSLGATYAYVVADGGVAGVDHGGDVPLRVVASFYPMYIASMNLLDGVDGVELSNLSEPQTGCLHDYELTPADMKSLDAADVLIVNGGGLEPFLDDVRRTHPQLTIVDASAKISGTGHTDAGHTDAEHTDTEHEEHSSTEHTDADHDEHADAEHTDEEHEEHSSIEHADAEHEEHSHAGHTHGEGENAHYWMSPALYAKQVDTIAEGLAGKMDDDEMKSVLEVNRSRYHDTIDELVTREKELAEHTAGKRAVLFHMAYAYTAADLGLDVKAILDLDEERQVSAGEVRGVCEALSDGGLILAEEAYGRETAEVVTAQTGADVAYLDPMTRGETSGDTYRKDAYERRMGENLTVLEEKLR